MTKNDPKLPEENSTLPQVANLTGVQVDKVAADMARVHRSAVGSIEAQEVELYQSAAGQINADYVSTHNALLGEVHSGAATINGSAVVMLQAQDAALNGPAGIVSTQNAVLSDGASMGIMLATSVKAEKVRTVLLIASEVEGPVETVLDTRRVVLASLLAGAAAGAVVLLGQLFFGRRKG